MRHYDNCFTGADAVDVVLTYLLSDKNTFSNDLSRDKAIKLCQSLMERNVFSPVSCRTSEIKIRFDDSYNTLYRFVGKAAVSKNDESFTVIESGSDEENDCSIMNDTRDEDIDHTEKLRINPEVEPDLIGDDVICNPIAVNNKQGHILQEILSIHKSFKRRKSRSSIKSDTSMLMRSMSEKHDVSPEALEELWREVALCQLLTIIDLPILDGLLAEEKPRKNLKANLVISNVVAKHWNMPVTAGSKMDDPFMRSALNCIECLPQGLSVLEKDFTKESTPASKIQAFHFMDEHYHTIDEPLLPERFLELHLAVLNLVLQQKDTVAIEALQLDMILLPWHIREELHRLLKFMSAAMEESAFQIDPKLDNETTILNTFTDNIFKHKVVAPKLSRVLVGFMVHRLDDIFTVPKEIRDRVLARIEDVKSGEVSPVRDNTYCRQVSVDEYDKQAEECTQNALVSLMNNILDDTKLSLKDKKQRLKQFQKYHPNLYSKHFSGML
ncbi:hypothetical protein KUTeg_007585 [Tegillarca granosa]|uniref:DEP domain-containing protein n=1 Tax=Tegillarca granosa TaxID=220873 RepID=A0ABQ9FIB5_TEGGR|nr:hypothetical protein KUTeg_007585 [Tegillarca granosa]